MKPRRFTQSHAVILTCAGLSLVLITPVMAMSVPWFSDLFFHMARMAILEAPDSPYISDWYRTDWQLLPNLAMDLIVPRLGLVMSTEAATRVFVAATFVLIFSGTLALHHAVHKKVTWFPLIGCLFVYNWIVFLGFFNFLFGIGLSLWALAAWFRCGHRSIILRLALGTVSALGLYICHLFPLGLYGLVVASGEFNHFRQEGGYGPHDIARSVAATTIPFLIPLALLLTSRTVAAASPGIDYVLAAKLFAPLVPFITLDLPIDLTVAAGVVALGYVLVRERALHVAPEMRLVLIALPILIVALPTFFFGTDLGDFRLPAAGIFIAIAACDFDARGKRPLAIGMAVFVACLFAVRMTGIAIDFLAAEGEMDAVTRQYRQMKPGAVLFTGTFEHKSFVMNLFGTPESWFAPWHRRNTMQLRHVGTLAVLYRPVFVPETAMIDGQQPVEMRLPYRELKAFQSLGYTARLLASADDLNSWLGEIRKTVSRPPYRFTAIYIALSDPSGVAKPPAGVTEIFSDYHYRMWDATAWMAR